jgi:hypothetical protein
VKRLSLLLLLPLSVVELEEEDDDGSGAREVDVVAKPDDGSNKVSTTLTSTSDSPCDSLGEIIRKQFLLL